MSKTRLPMKAWAIVEDISKPNYSLDCWDDRLPVFWNKKQAEKEQEKSCIGTKVVPVIISAASKGK